MKKLIEICIHGDDYFFMDDLSEEQYEQVLLLAKKRFGKHSEGACQIDEFLSDIKQRYSITLERAVISKVIAF